MQGKRMIANNESRLHTQVRAQCCSCWDLKVTPGAAGLVYWWCVERFDQHVCSNA